MQGLFWGDRFGTIRDPVGTTGRSRPEAMRRPAVLHVRWQGKAPAVLGARSGTELARAELGGVPDVIVSNRDRRHLYVAIEKPGLVEGVRALYVVPPDTHRALVFQGHG